MIFREMDLVGLEPTTSACKTDVLPGIKTTGPLAAAGVEPANYTDYEPDGSAPTLPLYLIGFEPIYILFYVFFLFKLQVLFISDLMDRMGFEPMVQSTMVFKTTTIGLSVTCLSFITKGCGRNRTFA